MKGQVRDRLLYYLKINTRYRRLSHDVLKWDLVHLKLKIESFQQRDPRRIESLDKKTAIATDQ